jgi:hypothetical protein
MKNILTFEQFINEAINESWPFEGKMHISAKEETILYNLLSKKKTSILYNNGEGGKPGTLKDKRFQTDNEEEAWELFEIWASACTMDDLRIFLQEYTGIRHDDIYDKDKSKEMGELGTNKMLSMIRNRGPEDLKILKLIKILK